MKQLLDIYFFAKHVEKVAKEMNPDHVVKPLTFEVMASYKKWHRFTSGRKLKLIFGQAVEWQYMKEVKEDLEGLQVRKIELLTKGWRILDTYPFVPFVSAGLIQAWGEEDNWKIKAILALLFGGFGVVIEQGIIATYRLLF